ncbi:MAG TPA: helix-turn-helix transcriptional regulator, partial [Sphingomonadales bacterium]
ARPDEVAPFFQDGAEDDEVLSSREREIVHLVAAGLSSKEIALKLDLALGTVKTYRKRIHRKLGAVSRSDMIAKARAQGILA